VYTVFGVKVRVTIGYMVCAVAFENTKCNKQIDTQWIEIIIPYNTSYIATRGKNYPEQ